MLREDTARTHFGVRELEAVRGADDNDAVFGADHLPLAQLRQRRQRHACGAQKKIASVSVSGAKLRSTTGYTKV